MDFARSHNLASVTERNSLLALSRIALTASGELHIATAIGEYKGHSQGDFVLDEAAIDSMIANFSRIANDVVIDYEHDSVSERNGPHPAAGWIKSLEKRPGADGVPELWAKVEWTDRAAEMIKSGEYKYCSPVIDYASIDRVSAEEIGVELFNCAITNNPFLDGQAPIALSRRAATRVPMTTKPKHTDSKKTAEKPEEEEEIPASKTAAENPVAAEDGDAMASAADMLAEALGTDRDQAIAALVSNLDAVVAACKGSTAEMSREATEASLNKEAIAAAVEEVAEQRDVLNAEVVELRKKVAKYETVDLNRKLDDLVKDGFLLSRNRERTRKVLMADPSFEAVLRSQQRVVPELQGDDEQETTDEREVKAMSARNQRRYVSLRNQKHDHKAAMKRIAEWDQEDNKPTHGAA